MCRHYKSSVMIKPRILKRMDVRLPQANDAQMRWNSRNNSKLLPMKGKVRMATINGSHGSG